MRLFATQRPGMLLTAMVALLLAACGPTATATPESTTSPTPEAAASPEEVLAQAREAMAAQEGFRGGTAFSPTQLQLTITYGTPDRMLLEGLGGDFYPYMFPLGDEVLYSHDGRHWLTSTEMEGTALVSFFRLFYDPRTALVYARDPEFVGEEVIDERPHRVLRVGLDRERFLGTLAPPEGYLRLSLSFPYPEEADARALEGLGYEVFGAHHHAGTTWQALKGPYHLSIHERAQRPNQPEPEGEVGVSATVQGVASLEPEVEAELRAALEAYGADPDLLERARVIPVVEDPREELGHMVQDLGARLWIDAQTGLVRRLALEHPSGRFDGAVLAFWGFGESVSLERPPEVMDSRRAGALASIARQGYDTFNQALEVYQDRHGRYPEDLTTETLEDALAELELSWPHNPFRDAPMRNSPESPGDFHYIGHGDTYHLSVYGWDNPMVTRMATPPSPPAATPVLPEEPLEEGLARAGVLEFPVLWLGEDVNISPQEGAPPLRLVLTRVEVCPPERGCVWPVALDYSIDAPEYPTGGPLVQLHARPRLEGEESEGEPAEIAGREARVQIGEKPLRPTPHDVAGTAWEGMVWLPETVVRVYVTPLGRAPDRNPFSSEAALSALVEALEELP